MKLPYFLFSAVLLGYSCRSLALTLPQDFQSIKQKYVQLSHQNNSTYVDDTSNFVRKNNIYLIITSGVETNIKNYFRSVSYDELTKSDSSSIVKAINIIGSKEKVTRTIWILEEVKNREIDIRNHVYKELLKVNYKKSNYIVRSLINNYFSNYKEQDSVLSKQIIELQKRMNR